MPESIPAAEPDFAAFIGIDWADREHVWAMQEAGSTRREKGKFEQTAEAIEAWAMQWAARFPGRLVAVALEQGRGALLYALSKYPHLLLYPIHPSTSADYRKAIFPSGSKDDGKDAGLLLDLLSLHRDRLRALRPDTEASRKLRDLVEKRRQLVDERTAQTNRITHLLKLYFPQVLDWFDEVGTPIVAAFLQRWPTLPQLQQETPEVLRTFFHQHGSRSAERIEERVAQIPQARPLVEDAAVVEPAVLMVQVLLRVVAVLGQGIEQMERAITPVFTTHPDHAIFSSFPAAGLVMGPRLLAAFGSRRERYPHAQDLQSFSGIAPVYSGSSEQSWIHFRWACPKFLRQTFHEYARGSIQQCAWAKAYYLAKLAAGHRHHDAVRSLAYKWIRILHACWKSGKPYDEQIYMRAQQSRRDADQAPAKPRPAPKRKPVASPAAAAISQPSLSACGGTVELQFKSVSGFWKIVGVTS